MNVSLLSLECVMSYIDVNKRIKMCICYPSIRNLEKSVPIQFDYLGFTPWSIKINDTCYKFGQIQDVSNFDEIGGVEEEIIKINNRRGGVEWRNTMNVELESGDVQLKNSKPERRFLEEEKHEIVQSIWHMYMGELEKYLAPESTDYEMSGYLLTPSYLQNVNQLDSRIATMIEKMNKGMYLSDVKFAVLYRLMSDVNQAKMERDELTELYPNAFEAMNSVVQEFKGSWFGKKNNLLTKLAYPQLIYPHFNQLTIFDKDDVQIHSNRLPDGLSLRRAFKQFSTTVFGGRLRNIQSKKFRIGGKGIIGLPEGFEIEHVPRVYHDEEMSPGDNWFLDAYLSLVRNADRMIFSVVKTYGTFSSPDEVIIRWLKNENRKIGSLLLLMNSDGITDFRSPRLLKYGFRDATGSSSIHRPLNGGRKAVLDRARVFSHIPVCNLFKDRSIDTCFAVQILKS